MELFNDVVVYFTVAQLVSTTLGVMVGNALEYFGAVNVRDVK